MDSGVDDQQSRRMGELQARWHGWEFIYSNDRTQLMAILYTFSKDGKPTWLSTSMAAFQPDGTWRAKFYKHTATSPTTETLTHKGSVAVRFFPNDPTRAAVRWSWEQLHQISAFNQDECLSDFNRAGPVDPQDVNSTSSVSSATPLVQGPSTISSGYWNSDGTLNKAPGVTITPYTRTRPVLRRDCLPKCTR